MINVVIPMAGKGSRFAEAGYKNPKPFIDVNGKTMIERVLDNLSIPGAKYYLISRKEFANNWSDTMNKIEKEYNARFIEIDHITEGAALTVLKAREMINNDTPLLMANSDQIVDIDIGDFVKDSDSRGLDGSILIFIDPNKDTKWSFAKIDDKGLVTEVKEKEAISDYATVGIYYYKKGADFVNYTIDMFVANDRVKGEFYTCPVYNYAVRDGKKIGIYNMEFEKMHGIGTPDDLNTYLAGLS